MNMPRVISDMNISHILSWEQEQLQRLIYKEEYEDAMNKLPIYEREVIKNVIEKIRYDELWGDCFNEKEKERQKREERILKMEQEEERKKKQRKSTKIKAVGILCVGTIVYSCAMLITR